VTGSDSTRRVPDLRPSGWLRLAARLRSSLRAGLASPAARKATPAAPWILGLLVYLAFVWSGRVAVERATLEVMGFDPDRADLIVALTLSAATAAVACLPRGQRLVPSLIGLLAGVAAFGPVFVRETQVALEPIPPNGPFDPMGWVLTVAALLSTGLAVGWAAAVLVGEIRTPVRQAWTVVRNLARRRRVRPRDAAPPAAMLIVAAIFLSSAPTMLDLMTAMPDVRMSTGGVPGVYFQPGPDVQEISGVSNHPSETPTETPSEPSPSPSETSSQPSPSPSPTGQITPKATPQPGLLFAPGPWLAWRPSGAGRIVQIDQPAPWTGGFMNVSQVHVYLPPGYDSSGRRYPVFYQAPWGFGVWEQDYHITAVLDSLIDSGRIPAAIVVFATEWGGPYSPSECANSADQREWFDRYVGEVLVSVVDGQFRTIPRPAARVMWGFSDGAHCAAILALHHPDLFGQAIAISGLYSTKKGDISDGDALPFGDDPALRLAYSPVAAAPTLPPAQRRRLYFIVAGDPADPGFGGAMTQFVQVLNDAGYPYMELRVGVIHGWDQVRKVFPTTFQVAAARMTDQGVFTDAGA
jgi:esterase/lipase superfamily enzyme